MAEQQLNPAYIRPGFQQMYGIGVAQRMGTYELFQTGPLTGPSHRVAYCSAADGLAGNISWKHPFSRTHLPPKASQQFQQLRGQLDIAALMKMT